MYGGPRPRPKPRRTPTPGTVSSKPPSCTEAPNWLTWSGTSPVREALDRRELRGLYDRLADHYDRLHAWLTAGSDERGRRRVTEATVRPGDRLLDAGGGTGAAAIRAAELAGSGGSVVLCDLSPGMLRAARGRRAPAAAPCPVQLCRADLGALPFPDASFDAVISTYSLCPVRDPREGALELYRALRPGGRLGVAHSTEPENRALRWLARRVESLAWRFPALSMGCRAVSVLPALTEAGGRVVEDTVMGVPLWPFRVFVVEKPLPGRDGVHPAG